MKEIPCKQCVVQPMCSQQCNQLSDYGYMLDIEVASIERYNETTHMNLKDYLEQRRKIRYMSNTTREKHK